MPELFKVALYIRVSTERQANEGDSLEEQQSELRKYCDFRQFSIHNIYIERGKSGGNTNRPEYQKLVKDINQRKINAVVVKKLDRLSRSLLDFENLMRLMNEKDVEFISIKENFDTTTAMGKAMLRVALVFAQLEREQTSERLIDVMDYRARMGMYNGGVRPLGYTPLNKELVPYKKEKLIIELMFDKFLEARSTTHTARFLNETGYRDRNNKLFDNRQVQCILQNPVYIGKIRWKKEIYPGLHQPIISEKKFNLVQQIFNDNLRAYEAGHTKALLQKLIYCGSCDSPMTPSFAYNRTRKRYYYYRCTSTAVTGKGRSKCSYKYVSYTCIEKNLFNILLSLGNEAGFKPLENKIMKYNQQIERHIQDIEKAILQLEHELDKVKDKKDRYLDSLISSQFQSREREVINAKINELEQEEKQLKVNIYKQQFERNQRTEDVINLTQFKQTLIRFKTEQDTFTPEQLRQYLTQTIRLIHYHPDKLGIQFHLLPWEEVFATP